MPRDDLDEQIEQAIKQADRLRSIHRPTDPKPASPQPSNTTSSHRTEPEADATDPLRTLEEWHDHVGWFNAQIRWCRNAFHKISGKCSKAADVGIYIWDHGLGQTCKFVGRLGSRLGRAYVRFFNWACHTKDPKTGEERFSKPRAVFVMALTLAVPFAIYHTTQLVIRPVYHVGTRLVFEQTERLYLYNAEPVPAEPHTWTVSASRSPLRDSGSAEKMLIRRNAAYWRWAEDTEALVSAIAEHPELFQVTYTGGRIRLPGGFMMDLYPEIQAVQQIDVRTLNMKAEGYDHGGD